MIRSIPPIPAENATPLPAWTPESAEGGPRVLTLDSLAHASLPDAAVIEGVEGAPTLRRRLLEAGFTAGSPVRFVMATPFGDPLVFSLRGASIALRKTEARCVRVRF
jgi:ferrous iron transport protein A